MLVQHNVEVYTHDRDDARLASAQFSVLSSQFSVRNDRLPLPSRRRDVRGAISTRSSRRAQDAGARAGAGHPRGRQREGSGAGRAASRRSGPTCACSIGVHPHQAHEFADDPERAAARRARRSSPRRRRRARSARSASTTTTTSRRATCSRRCSAPSCGSRASSTCRSSSTRARPTTTRSRSCARRAAAAARRAALLHRHAARWRDAGLELGFYISLAGILTFPKAAELRETARARAARSAADRNRQPVSGAGAVSRQAERAGVRRARGRGAGRAARTSRPASSAGGPPRISTPCSGRDKVLT